MKRTAPRAGLLFTLIIAACRAMAAHPADGDWLSDDPAFHQKGGDTGGRLSLAVPELHWLPQRAVVPASWRCDRLSGYAGRAVPSTTPEANLELAVKVCSDEPRQTCVLRTADTMDCVTPAGAASRWQRIPQALSSPQHATRPGTLLATLDRETARTPVLDAVLHWHDALLAGDFAAYRQVTPGSVLSDETQRIWFDQLRRSVPRRLWTAGERAVGDGEQLVVLANCLSAHAFGSELRVAKVQDRWLVRAPADFSFFGKEGLYHCPVRNSP